MRKRVTPLFSKELILLYRMNSFHFTEVYKAGLYNAYPAVLPNGLLVIKSYNLTMQEIFGYQNFVAIMKG